MLRKGRRPDGKRRKKLCKREQGNTYTGVHHVCHGRQEGLLFFMHRKDWKGGGNGGGIPSRKERELYDDE